MNYQSKPLGLWFCVREPGRLRRSWRKSRRIVCFGCCQVQKLKKSQNCFVLDVVKCRKRRSVQWNHSIPKLKARQGMVQSCENTRAAWQLFFTARTWAKPHRFDSSVTLLLRRVVQSKTQWHSNVFKLLKLLQKSSQASKTFFQLLQIKRLQLKLTNNLQNSYQISSQHQVPKTWVKQHPKTPKTTKTNENPSPSSSMHKLVPFGSKLVPTWFL